MTDDRPELDFDESADTGRLLGELLSTDSLPSEVEARLDATLARLVSARGSAQVVDLSQERRRRRLTLGVAAAAAASVVAIGLGSLSEQGGFGSTSADSAGSESAPKADAETGGLDVVTGSPNVPAPRESPLVTVGPLSDGVGFGSRSQGVPSFTANRFASQVAEWVATERAEAYAWSGACAVPNLPPSARVFAAFYDHAPAALIVLPPRDGFQTISIAECAGDGRVLNSTTIPAG